MDTPRIFIVEDDALVVSHLQQILEEFNYQVAGIAASGNDALELVANSKPDLILMDIRIRGPLNGLETAKIISRKQNIPIIFLTAHANKEYLAQAQVENAFSYLLKPIRSVDLHTNIQMALFNHQTQQRLNIVNTILKTRQKLNRLILEKTDKNDLLTATAQLLVKSGVFASSLIVTDIHFSLPKFYYYPEGCAEMADLKNYIHNAELPICLKQALNSDKVVTFKNSDNDCQLCPLNKGKKEHYHMSYQIKFRNNQYGLLTTFLAPTFFPSDEIVELFKELCDDLAFALHKFELEELQQKALKALEESEYKYRVLSENALVGVFLVQDEKFKYVNPQMANIFKYDNPKEILQLEYFLDLCHPSNHTLIKEIFEKILNSKDEALHIEFSGKDKYNQKLEIELLASRIEYQGETAILGTLFDITEKKAKDQIIRLLLTGIKESPVAIIITDSKGKIEYVNPAFSKISGYSKTEAIGKNPNILKSGEMPEEFYVNLWETIKKGEAWTDEIINRKKDGSLYCARQLITPIKNEHNQITHFLGIQEDISEKKKLERQLLQSQKMEAIGRLAGGIAHDFNNLLTVINGYAQLLLYSSSEDDPNRKKVEQILQAGEKAKSLTSQLLAFSRKQMRQIQKLNLNKVIEDYFPMVQSLIGENILVEKQLSSDLWTIESDKHQIEQILLNLIVNAKQAMPEGGKLTIITRNVTLNEEFISENEGARSGPFVQLSITDTGVGMDEETLKHIFEPFFTTRGVGEGTGLGLSTVYGIVKQNDGLIYVTSAPGHGAIFDIYFPKADGEDSQTTKAEQSSAEELFGSASILLVEDDLDVRNLISRSLSYFGFKVTAARDGKEALEKLKESSKKFDLLITDIIMPNLSGQKLADMVHQSHPELPVLFISGYTDNELKSVPEKELTNFLQKPFSPIDLAKKIKDVLNG